MRYWYMMFAAAVFLTLAAPCLTVAYAADVEASPSQSGSESPKDQKAEDPVTTKARNEYFKGMGMVSHGNFEKAVEHFKAALALDPRNYNTLLMLGKTYTRVGKQYSSVDVFKNAITVKPDDPRAYDLLMQLYLFFGQPENSLKTAQDALKAGVDEEMLPDLGWTYYQLGKNDEAEARFKKDTELYNDAFGPVRNLGLVYFTKGEYKKALDCFDKAEKLEPENKVLPYIQALTYEKLGMTAEAARATAIYKKRDRGYMNNVAKYNKTYFPHTDPGNVSRYLFLLKKEVVEPSNNEGGAAKPVPGDKE